MVEFAKTARLDQRALAEFFNYIHIPVSSNVTFRNFGYDFDENLVIETRGYSDGTSELRTITNSEIASHGCLFNTSRFGRSFHSVDPQDRSVTKMTSPQINENENFLAWKRYQATGKFEREKVSHPQYANGGDW
jgi:hypothetical protein